MSFDTKRPPWESDVLQRWSPCNLCQNSPCPASSQIPLPPVRQQPAGKLVNSFLWHLHSATHPEKSKTPKLCPTHKKFHLLSTSEKLFEEIFMNEISHSDSHIFVHSGSITSTWLFYKRKSYFKCAFTFEKILWAVICKTVGQSWQHSAFMSNFFDGFCCRASASFPPSQFCFPLFSLPCVSFNSHKNKPSPTLLYKSYLLLLLTALS